MKRPARALAFPRDALGNESVLEGADFARVVAGGFRLQHYLDPRDKVDYLASFSVGKLELLQGALAGQKVEATPVVVAATRQHELDLYVWKIYASCAVLWLVSLTVAFFFVRTLVRRDRDKLRT